MKLFLSPSVSVFLLVSVPHHVLSDPLQEAVQSLLSYLQPTLPPPPLGSPFPHISGPAPHDRVCIVGAGPAGVHMALSLKRNNFTRVELFEKSNRVGGKSFDITLDGVTHPQGTIFAEANYFKNLIPLAREFGVGEIVRAPAPGVWLTNSAPSNSHLPTGQFVLGSLSKLTNSSSPKVNVGFLLKTTIQYVALHRELFGTYEGDLMLRPSPSTLHRVRGTFLEFLTRENLLAMVPVLRLSNTLQGYGYLDEISALYGLIWNNVQLITAVALRALRKDKEPLSVYVLKNGFETVWKTIVEKENLTVHFNVDISSIKRNNNNVELRVWSGALQKTEVCDWMIWTPPMTDLIRTAVDPTPEEFSLLGSLKPTIFTASLVNMKNEVRKDPYSAFMENIEGKVEHGVTADSDMRGILSPNIGTPDGLANYTRNIPSQKTLFCLQMGDNSIDERTVNKILKDHYEQGYQAEGVDILNTISWPYFPRWSPSEMETGRHWDVFEKLQGRNRMWYAGSSVSFESIRGVMEYNSLLMRQKREDVKPHNSFYKNPLGLSRHYVRRTYG